MENRRIVFIPIVPPTSGLSEAASNRVEGELIEVYSQLYLVDHDIRDTLTDRELERHQRSDNKAKEKDASPILPPVSVDHFPLKRFIQIFRHTCEVYNLS